MLFKNLFKVSAATSWSSRAFNTELNQEIRHIQKTCRDFAEKELQPRAGDIDKNCK